MVATHRIPLLAVVAVGIALASFAAAAAVPAEYKGLDLPRHVTWRHWDQRAFDEAAAARKPIMLLVVHTSCQTSKDEVIPGLSVSRQFYELSKKFVMTAVSDVDPSWVPDHADLFAPDGFYTPRVIFISPDGELMNVINEVAPKVAYFYWDVEGVLNAMRKALHTFNPNEPILASVDIDGTISVDGDGAGEAMEHLVDDHEADTGDFVNDLLGQADSSQVNATEILEEAYKHVETNFTHFVYLANVSANLGNHEAMHTMSTLHTHGLGVPRSDMMAVLYHTMAALGEGTFSSLALAHRHSYGIAVKKNCNSALRHIKTVAPTIASTMSRTIPFKREDVKLGVETGSAAENELVELHIYRADRGQTNSMLFLGYAHVFGLHKLAQDAQLAINYFERALAMGDNAGHAALGMLFAQGMDHGPHPVERNETLALEHFNNGSKADNTASWNGMGFMYANGLAGLEQDFGKAAKYFELSANAGNAEGMYNLGVLMLNGEGVVQDIGRAQAMFSKAAALGSTLGYYQLANIQTEIGGGVKQCHDAVKNFRKTVTQSKMIKNYMSMAHEAYLDGDYTTSILHYLIIAETGYELARANAAYILQMGYGLEGVQLQSSMSASDHPQDVLRQRILKSIASISAEEGSIEAHNVLGDHYFTGDDGEGVDMSKAEEHYRAAASGGNAQAMYNLGYMHQHGVHLAQDFHLAKRFYDQALAASGDKPLAAQGALLMLEAHWHWMHSELPKPFGYHIEDFTLAVLVGLAGVLLLLRHQATVDE